MSDQKAYLRSFINKLFANNIARLFGVLFIGLFLAISFLVAVNKPISISAESQQSIKDDTLAGPDITITKQHSIHFIRGDKGVYTITVKNIGTADISGLITVSDQLPANLSFISGGGSGWNNCTNTNPIICSHPNGSNLGVGAELPPLFLTVSVAQKTVTNITNRVTLTNVNDISDTHNHSVDLTDISADLAVSKIMTPTNPPDGSYITYTLTITNLGPNDAPRVVLTDLLPSAKLIFITYTPNTEVYSSTIGRWNVGNLALNQSKSLRIRAQVKNNACGSVTNANEGLTSDLPDGVSGNNTSSVSFDIYNTCLHGLVTIFGTTTPINAANIRVKDSANHIYNTTTEATGWYTFNDATQPLSSGSSVITATKTFYKSEVANKNLIAGILNRQDFQLMPAVDLRISKTNGKNTVIPGETFSYTINISNTGYLTASQVIITDTWSSQLSFIRDSLINQLGVISRTIGSTRVWTLTNGLNPGEGKIFTIRAQVANPLASGTITVTNSIRTSTSDIEEDKSNNTAKDVDYTPNPSITKSVSPTEARAGSRFAFSITIKNNGKVDMTDVVINDTFPTYLTYYSASTSKGTYSFNTSTRTFTANVGTLAPNESVTITINMTVNSTATTTTTLSNSATMTFKHGGSSQTATSNSVSYRVIGTTSLPGTGGMPSNIAKRTSTSGAGMWAAVISSVLIGLAGLVGLLYGFTTRKKQTAWSAYALRMGAILLGVGCVFGIAAWGFSRLGLPGPQVQQAIVLLQTPTRTRLIKPTPSEIVAVSPYGFQDYETLPNYPVPTPAVSVEGGTETPKDTTSPNRLLIPNLGVDTIIKYVPFDGFSWLISGLQNEIAWMGDTSWPGLGSNTGFAGHVTLRNGADGPFKYLETLKPGDEISISTEQNIYQYKVSALTIVEDSDMSVTGPSEKSIITLITCTGWDPDFGHFLKRLIVTAELAKVTPIKLSSY